MTAARPAVSFEFYPPKTPEQQAQLERSVTRLKTHAPKFVSVTFGAGGSTLSYTPDTVRALRAGHGLDAVPHLSCMGGTRGEIAALLTQYRELGCTRVVALRGDLPSGMATPGKPMTTSQQRMAECSHQSKGMMGAAHKKFMSECMKGHAAAPMAGSKSTMAGHEMAKPMMGGKHMMSSKAMQQEKMKDCSAEAKTKKLSGAARKTFMSTCLKGG